MPVQQVRFVDVGAVLFDLDGTLIDSAPDLAGAVETMRLKRGLPPLPLSDYRPMAGAGARGMLGVGFGITPDHPDFDALRDEFFLAYEQRLTRNTIIFQGVASMIEMLVQRQLPWGVVTNKSKRFTLPLTQAMPLFRSAKTIVSGDSTAFSKPHPQPLLEAAQQLGIAPNRCVYVGDDERDIVAGKAAGMMTVAVTYGYLGQKTDTGQWGADTTINSADQLLHLLPPP
ncbi:MAG: HAD-IA family hydrolase [Rhodoferax sp.]|nr:HAD-IA family hydrolase [Rhodoferax sp.]